MVSRILMLESNHQLKCNFEIVHFFLVHFAVVCYLWNVVKAELNS